MSEYWAYPGADMLAILVINGASLAAMICASLFVLGHGE